MAEGVFAVAKERETGANSWNAVVLDVRYSSDGQSFSDKCRIEMADGTLVSASLPVGIAMQLIALGDSRLQGADRWYGMIMTITGAGKCSVAFNYDPNCESDPSFYES